MVVRTLIKENLYRDSVALMSISSQLSKVLGVTKVSVMMGTMQNKAILNETGLFNEKIDAARPNDLIIIVNAIDEPTALKVMQLAESLLESPSEKIVSTAIELPICLEDALRKLSKANLVSISTPGAFASAEAMKALKKGMHVFIFSDNVSLEEELELKMYAHQHGLLVMGPDCGTSCISGVPLGFVNQVKEGGIGIVGASGTGIQEIMCIADRLGAGISHVIGTGGRDLSQKVGAITMLDALEALALDETTKVIVVVSKPPTPDVASKVFDILDRLSKPVVTCFLGHDFKEKRENVKTAKTLEDTALEASAIALGHPLEIFLPQKRWCDLKIASHRRRGYIRGLFSGGTLAYEALILLHQYFPVIYSNIALTPEERLIDPNESIEHTIIDMGSDEFTLGKPHPMIDFSSRIERIKKEVIDPSVSVILLDLVLGLGAHSDPASELVPIIKTAVANLEGPKFVVHIVGTNADPQDFVSQEVRLKEAGAIMAESNASAAYIAAVLANGELVESERANL